MADVLNGWAVGEGGGILDTRSAGATWTPQTSGTGNDLHGVAFLRSPAAAVPEPGALTLLGLGLAGLVAACRRARA